MLENSTQPLSVATLFAEREAHLCHEKEMEEQLVHKKEEELADYKKRLRNSSSAKLSPTHWPHVSSEHSITAKPS